MLLAWNLAHSILETYYKAGVAVWEDVQTGETEISLTPISPDGILYGVFSLSAE